MDRIISRTAGTPVALATLLAILFAVVGPSLVECAERQEILRFVVTWNGSQAGHGDIMTKTGPKHVEVVVQAVSDGALKAICEIWSRVQATFAAKTFQPKTYTFTLKSNLLRRELVEVKFDHETKMVQVDKLLGNERESHSEAFSNVYDPVTAVFLLRSQRDLSKAMYVDIFDGKDRARLFVEPVGSENIKIATGVHPAVRMNLRLSKLSGNKEELANGQLWISNDQSRIPLLLTSSHVVGNVRFELVQVQL